MLRQTVRFAACFSVLALAGSGVAQQAEMPEWEKEPIKAEHLRYQKLLSPTIKGEVSYLIYLPASYEKDKARRYPVMYWLHGIGGAQTGVPRFVERVNRAIETGKTPAMLVVFVNGVKNSFYCDSADGKVPVETVIVKDLIPHIDKTYHTIAKREGRLIEGFSMGGFGAAHLGFKYPELFGSVSLIDAVLLNAATMESRHAELYKRIFGGKKEAFEAEDPRTLVEKNVEAIRGRTAVRLAVGALQPGNKSYHELLTRLKIAHEYEVFAEAGHNHGAIYEKLGEGNWQFYRQALGQDKAEPKGPPKLPKGVTVEIGLEYAQAGGKKLLLDLYRPEKAEGPLPVIIGIHGGAWMGGSKEGAPGRHMAARGYAVACLNYRLSGEALFPAQIEDCKAAVRWLRANAKKYNLDADRFGATGHSAGGHLASLLGTAGDIREFDKGDHLALSSRVQAVCAMAGPTDFLQMDANAPAGAKLKHDLPGSPESRLVGGPIQDNKGKVAKANPITFVTKDDPPFLLIHGDQDAVVPAHQAQLLYEALTKVGGVAKLHLIKGGGHQFGGPEVNKEVNNMMAAFFDSHLKKVGGTAKSPKTSELPGFKLDGTKWTYKDDKLSMEGVLLKPEGEGPFPAILISHGKGGSAGSFGMGKAQEFVKWGLVCIAPNYTHAGGKANKPEPKGGDGASEVNLGCALKCLDILESLKYVDKKRLAAYGHSMGGFVTIGMAPAASDRLKAAAITGSGIAAKAGFPAPTAELAGKVRTPFLIMHGSLDKAVRPEQSAQFQRILDQNKVANQRHVFEGEDHPIDQTKRAEVFQLIRQWLAKQGVLTK